MKFFMAFAVIFCLAVCFASQSLAFPAEGAEEAQLVDSLEAVEPEMHGRHKRATCDLLSAFGVNDSACAAHCILLGRRGGYCNGKSVCVCR